MEAGFTDVRVWIPRQGMVAAAGRDTLPIVPIPETPKNGEEQVPSHINLPLTVPW